MNICDKCKNYYPNNHYCQYWDCDVTIQHETCCGFANMTNADRIRTMSDNELAWELMLWRCEAAARHHGIDSQYPDTQSTILVWLQQPVEPVKEDA